MTPRTGKTRSGFRARVMAWMVSPRQAKVAEHISADREAKQLSARFDTLARTDVLVRTSTACERINQRNGLDHEGSLPEVEKAL